MQVAYYGLMREASWFGMLLALVAAVIIVTQLNSWAVAVLPSTSGLFSTAISALPFIAVLMLPMIVVYWLASK